ncbi:diguanylate cyclase [Sanguibacter antarcticus]|uniref:Diguanylate cyclase with PAS/PAC sensor n=1 Tax=Sanguibacter antarcticus TaxID=372484 RepID=A0A2A9E7G7_9MICO|nr:diguanylate cyclase [Sanguibacter antarcticus]PFG34255.1 diguanylate cyclase with PAS/PAC sensor [Sanguibacter antarcticus]
MVNRQPLELADVDRVVARLLRTHPGATVAGLRADGSLVAAPPALRLGRQRQRQADRLIHTHRSLHAPSALDLVAPAHRERVAHAWDAVLRARVADTTVDLVDGGAVALHLVDARPRHGVLLAVITTEDGRSEIDRIRADHEQLRAREQLLHRLTETLPSGVVQIDEAGRIVHKNDRTALLVGNPAATTLVDQLGWCAPEDSALVRDTIEAVLTRAQDGDIEVKVDAPGLARRVFHVALRALTTDTGQVSGAICSLTDVTQASVLRHELAVRATVDSLTGCHNRASIMATLHGAMAGEKTVTQRGIAVIFVDLDRFKSVNDRFGHAMGDAVLAAAADRMRTGSRSRDVVGRVGGDEFVVVCPDVGGPADALHTAQRIADLLREPVEHQGMTIATSASVGVAWTDSFEESPDALVAEADAAMYRSKRAGTGQAVGQ